MLSFNRTCSSKTQVVTQKDETECFSIEAGFHQGSAMVPFPFSIAHYNKNGCSNGKHRGGSEGGEGRDSPGEGRGGEEREVEGGSEVGEGGGRGGREGGEGLMEGGEGGEGGRDG